MAKKKVDRKKKDEEPVLPKFAGFHPLAGGLQGFKVQLDADTKKKKKPEPEHRPPPRPEPARPPTSAIEDEQTFHRMMSGVTPLAEGGRARIPMTADVKPGAQKMKAAEMSARAAVDAEKALDHLHSLVETVVRFEVSDDGRRVEGRRASASPDLLRSLRRGLLPIDGRLDLHGMSAPQAHEALVQFLRTMRARSERCVLVIHGKGERHAGAGVLRGEIAAWLSQGKGREHVAAFATARDDDGGEGAVYVALQR